MTKLITLTEEGISYSNEIFAYKEFKNITKSKLHKLLTYLYLNYSSPNLAKWSKEEREEEAVYQSKITEEEIKEYKKQIDLYTRLIRTPVSSALESSRETLYVIIDMNNKIVKELKKHIDSEEISIEEIGSIQSMIKSTMDNINKSPALINTLVELEARYNADMEEGTGLKGTQQKGFLS
jgi:hypothetical protein